MQSLLVLILVFVGASIWAGPQSPPLVVGGDDPICNFDDTAETWCDGVGGSMCTEQFKVCLQIPVLDDDIFCINGAGNQRCSVLGGCPVEMHDAVTEDDCEAGTSTP